MYSNFISSLVCPKKHSEFIRFCIVGSLCALIDAIVFYIFNSFTNYRISLVVGYSCGLIVNYILTVLWTFKVRPSISNAVGVVLAHFINLFVVRMLCMSLLVDYFDLSEKIAYIPTVVISVIVNFLMVKFAIRVTS